MPLADIIQGAQDYLLGTGQVDFLNLMLPDVLKEVARAFPVFTTVRVVSNTWMEGAWRDATTTYTDNTSNAQQAGGNVPLSTLVANDGILVGASGQFGQVNVVMQTVHAGGVPVYEWTYWNGAAWVALTTQSTPNFGALGTQSLVFDPPTDWVQATPSGVTFAAAVDSVQFWIRLRATTPPGTTAAVASQLVVYIHTLALPATTVALLALLFWPNELEQVTAPGTLDLATPSWRTTLGIPLLYTQELARQTLVRVTPIPSAQLGSLPALPSFMGLAFGGPPTNHFVAVVAHTPPPTDLPEWFESLVALALAAREAVREGETQALALGQSLSAVQQVVQQLFQEVLL